MIVLTKLDGKPVAINLESIKYIESMPDTVIFFMNGDSIIVKEPLATVVARSIELKSKIFNLPKQDAIA